MKNKTFPVLLLLLFSIEVFCQDNTVVVIQSEENLRFTVGNSYYSTTYNGIKNYMIDLKHDQPELHRELVSEFDQLTLKRNIGLGSSIGGIVVGSIVIISTFPSFTNDITDPSADHDIFDESKGIFAGIGIMAAGSLLALIIMPKEDDYLSWVNRHNRINSKNPIEWRIGLNYIPTQQIGGTLTLRF
ncbi:MAG: hypothetical protein WCX31_04965 [Salinivirgaceae bacterium]|jgi:hypothetical protein